MKEERYEDLKKKVQYLNDEGFAGEGKQFILFENADAAIDAIRQNQIPGITWTDQDEAKWQAQEAIRKALDGEEVETRTDEFNNGALDAPTLPEYREPIDWTTMPQEEVDFEWDALFEDDITTIEPKNNNLEF